MTAPSLTSSCTKCRTPIVPVAAKPGFTVVCVQCCLLEKSLKNVVIVHRKGA